MREVAKQVVPGRRLNVFESYAHRDEKLREELDKHLAALKRSDLIETWCDRTLTSRPRRAELAESSAGDEVIMSIAGHVSRAMLSVGSEDSAAVKSIIAGANGTEFIVASDCVR